MAAVYHIPEIPDIPVQPHIFPPPSLSLSLSLCLSVCVQEFAGNHLPFVGFTYSKGRRLLANQGGGAKTSGSDVSKLRSHDLCVMSRDLTEGATEES